MHNVASIYRFMSAMAASYLSQEKCTLSNSIAENMGLTLFQRSKIGRQSAPRQVYVYPFFFSGLDRHSSKWLNLSLALIFFIFLSVSSWGDLFFISCHGDETGSKKKSLQREGHSPF